MPMDGAISDKLRLGIRSRPKPYNLPPTVSQHKMDRLRAPYAPRRSSITSSTRSPSAKIIAQPLEAFTVSKPPLQTSHHQIPNARRSQTKQERRTLDSLWQSYLLVNFDGRRVRSANEALLMYRQSGLVGEKASSMS